MKEQGKDIQITLTKEFHTTYWKNKMNYFYYAILSLSAAFAVLIIGAVFDALPVITLNSVVVAVLLYFCVVMGTFASGLHFGMGEVGKQISKRIHEEHPELFVDLEKKDV